MGCTSNPHCKPGKIAVKLKERLDSGKKTGSFPTILENFVKKAQEPENAAKRCNQCGGTGYFVNDLTHLPDGVEFEVSLELEDDQITIYRTQGKLREYIDANVILFKNDNSKWELEIEPWNDCSSAHINSDGFSDPRWFSGASVTVTPPRRRCLAKTCPDAASFRRVLKRLQKWT